MGRPKTVRTDEIEDVTETAEITSDNDIHTSSDALFVSQMSDTSDMRTSLLRCNIKDPVSAKQAIQNVTVQRVYHQLKRIVRFTEMMDKIEDKMYESIDRSLESMQAEDPTTWATLIRMQGQLQTSMIESQKLLDPYLKSEIFEAVQIQEAQAPTSFATMMLEPDSRQKLRDSAAAVLAAIEASEEEQKDEKSNQS